jgi:hypothetical protein
LDSDHPTRKNPSIKISSSAYNTDGIFLGFDSGSPKMSIRNGSNALLWDGANLTISGSVVATDGRIAGWIIDKESLRDSNNKIILNPTTPSIGLFDNDAKKRVDIRFGALSDLSANSTEKDIDPPEITSSFQTQTGPYNFDGIFVTSSTIDTLTINSTDALTYYANVKWDAFGDASSPLVTTNETFDGYVSIDRGIQIRQGSTPIITIFANGVTVSGSSQSEYIKKPDDASNVVLTFPSPGSYDVYSFYVISGPFWSNNQTSTPATITINKRTWDNTSIKFTSEVDLIEMTSDGFQMLKNQNKYF